jgi:PTS system fructose-specific IIA component/PTS system nitrogen regulatory IIA component
MGLTDYVCEEAIRMDLAARERDEAVGELLEALVESGELPAELLDGLLRAVLEREKLGSTAIGRGLAVPHARREELDRILVCFGYSAEGIAFNALDGEPVHHIFLVVAPKGQAEEYLAIMQRITRLVQNEDFRRFVARTRTAEEVVALMREMAG